VGALAVARMCEAMGTPFVLGGVAWERLAIDPKPGPRPVGEIAGAAPLGDRAVLAGVATSTPEGVRFSESLIAEHLGTETVLVDVTGGAPGVTAAVETACAELDCDLVLLADVGGDILAVGDEPGLASPLCDAVMAAGAVTAGVRALIVVIGAGCDGELTPAEVLGRVAAAGRAGVWTGTWSPAPSVADEVAAAAVSGHTEASMQLARCARGETGPAPIRNGRRTVELSPVGALAFFLEPGDSLAEVAPLVPAVAAAGSIEAARDELAALGIRTELDYELERGSTSQR
jgi:hypothetical protein